LAGDEEPLIVLDASAVLAWLFAEPAADEIEGAFSRAIVPAPNWAEVLQKAKARSLIVPDVAEQILGFGMTITYVEREDAEVAADLWRPERNLSLADRFCLAVGQRLDAPIWTCDRSWAGVDERVVVLR